MAKDQKNLNYLYTVTSNVLIEELNLFFSSLSEELIIVENIKKVLIAAELTFPIFLTAIKLFRKVQSSKKRYLDNYYTKNIPIYIKKYIDGKEIIISNKINVHSHEIESSELVPPAKSRHSATSGFGMSLIDSRQSSLPGDLKSKELSLIYLIISDEYLIIIVSFVLSYKLHQDVSFTNDCWVGVSGIDNDRLNLCEKIVLEMLNYDLMSPGEENIILEIQKSNYYKNNTRVKKPSLKNMFCFR